jgi:hypothetical protein
LFRQTAEGQLLKGLGLYGPTDPQRPIVVTFQPYDKEKKALGDPMWMPRSEWQALEFTEMTTSREAWERAQGWMALMYVGATGALWVPGIIVISWLQHWPYLNWPFVIRFEVGAVLLFLVAGYRWLVKRRRWQVDLG